MRKVMLKQKVRLEVFTSAKKQMKETGLEIHLGHSGKVLGKVSDMFHLGKKIELIIPDDIVTEDKDFTLMVVDNTFTVIRQG